MADSLSELRIDEDGFVTAIVYRILRENQTTIQHVCNQYGVVVADLVTGVLKIAAFSNIRILKTSVLGMRRNQLEGVPNVDHAVRRRSYSVDQTSRTRLSHQGRSYRYLRTST